MSNGLNLLHPRKDVAEMVIVFVCLLSLLRVWCSWTWNEQVIEKNIEAEAAEQAAAEEKVAATAAAMKMNRIVSYQQGNHFGLSVGMCL